MRTLLVPALAALLALPAFAFANSPASAFDDASYPAMSRKSVSVERGDRATSAFDDAGLGLPEVAPAGPAAPAQVRIAQANPFDDAGLRGEEVAPAAEAAPVRVAERATASMASCSCCQS